MNVGQAVHAAPDDGVARRWIRGAGQVASEPSQLAALDGGACVPGWRVRIVDGNHLPGSQKRLAPLREHRGAALPGHALVVYDPDLAQVVDLVACY